MKLQVKAPVWRQLGMPLLLRTWVWQAVFIALAGVVVFVQDLVGSISPGVPMGTLIPGLALGLLLFLAAFGLPMMLLVGLLDWLLHHKARLDFRLVVGLEVLSYPLLFIFVYGTAEESQLYVLPVLFMLLVWQLARVRQAARRIREAQEDGEG